MIKTPIVTLILIATCVYSSCNMSSRDEIDSEVESLKSQVRTLEEEVNEFKNELESCENLKEKYEYENKVQHYEIEAYKERLADLN